MESIALFAGLSAEQLAIVKKHVSECRVTKHSYLFQMGDAGNELFIVISGEIDVLLPFSAHHYKRIATFGPGTYFGEVAFLNPGQRTASAKVIFDAHLLVLDNAALENLSIECPAAALFILKALAKSLSEHLRWADVELKQLMDW
jgi:SulP family sulfate permease